MALKRRFTFKPAPRFENEDELLAIATGRIQATTEQLAKNEDLIRGFILDSKISTGDACIPAAHVFSSFLTWTATPLSKHAFSRQFNKYFQPKHTRGFIYYKLNRGVFGLPLDYSCWSDTSITYFYKDRSTKYKGVTYFKDESRRGYYVDYRTSPDNRVLLGPYETPEEAALLYDKEMISKDLKRELNFYDTDLVWKPFRDIYAYWKKEEI
jgi:hypothetical protein